MRGSGGALLTDLVSLVRFALHHDGELVPFADQVEARFAAWVAQQESRGRTFTPEQGEWLVLIRDHIAANLGVPEDDLPNMAKEAHAIRRLLDNNPRELPAEEILAMYRRAF